MIIPEEIIQALFFLVLGSFYRKLMTCAVLV